jgi:hypothetical protein
VTFDAHRLPAAPLAVNVEPHQRFLPYGTFGLCAGSNCEIMALSISGTRTVA